MGGKSKQKTKTTPWKPAEPYIKDAMGGLQGAHNTAQDTIAQYSPYLKEAIGRIQQNIAAPPSYVTGARDMLGKTIAGDFVGSNPHTEGIAKLIADRAQGNYNQTFGASGRTHGGLAALLSGQGVGDALQSFYHGQHEAERGRQQQAIMASPGFHQGEYTDINALFPAVQGTAMMPLNAANAYGAGITNVTSPYNTNTQTQKQGGLGSILGLAGMIGGAFMPQSGLAGLLGGAAPMNMNLPANPAAFAMPPIQPFRFLG